jgi:hypothetical protein
VYLLHERTTFARSRRDCSSSRWVGGYRLLLLLLLLRLRRRDAGGICCRQSRIAKGVVDNRAVSNGRLAPKQKSSLRRRTFIETDNDALTLNTKFRTEKQLQRKTFCTR